MFFGREFKREKIMHKKIRISLISVFGVLTFILLFWALFLGQSINSYADSFEFYCSNNFNDELVEGKIEKDSVLVTLNENIMKQYSVYDFKDIGCVKVEYLTQFTSSYVNNVSRGNYSGSSMLVNTENYKQILKLNLSKSDTDNVIKTIEKLNKREDVLIAGPNYIYNVEVIPNDAYFGQDGTWGLNGAYGIQAGAAWNITTGSSDVIVGVIDSGIQADHPDLVNRISTDGLHRDCTVNPIMPVSNNDLVDANGHGTHVAGIIGAQGNNTIGVSGVCWDLRLVSLRVFDENGKGKSENIARAIDFAASQNIPILNFSGGSTNSDLNVQNALSNYDGLFVCSAGNGGPDGIGDNNDIISHYPSDYSYNKSYSDNIISVASLNEIGKRSTFSNYGKNTVSIYAPGDNILSTYPQGNCTGEKVQINNREYLECECEWVNINGTWGWQTNGTTHYENGYHIMSGTSMATPYVAGVAALMLSENPTLTGGELKTLILNAAENHSLVINGTLQTVKRLKASSAVNYVNSSDSNHIVFLKKTNIPDGYQNNYQFLWLKNGDPWPSSIEVPTMPYGYEFVGYYYNVDYSPDMRYRIYNANGTFNKVNYYFNQEKFEADGDIILRSYCKPKDYSFVIGMKHAGDWEHPVHAVITSLDFEETYSDSMAEQNTVKGITKAFTKWQIVIGDESYDYSTNTTLEFAVKDIIVNYCPDYEERGNPTIYFYSIYDTDISSGGDNTKPCITPGSLITLADGTVKPVEELTGSELLLVWNMQTGSFDSAPILFIDVDEAAEYQIINLSFSDGTEVEVIYEHAFWDFNLKEYVFLREDADKYIGHWFNKQKTDDNGDLSWSCVQLTDVVITYKYTTPYSPVTYGHLCYYVNGMLSMPGATESFINIFNVDEKTMSYDKEAFDNDIETFGLFTYEEFAELLPIPEEVFNAFSGQYLKVAIGKGLADIDTLSELFQQYEDKLLS